jgi:hypothetical protein
MSVPWIDVQHDGDGSGRTSVAVAPAVFFDVREQHAFNQPRLSSEILKFEMYSRLE